MAKENSWPKWLRVKYFFTHPPKPFSVTPTQGKFRTKKYWIGLFYFYVNVMKNPMNGILQCITFPALVRESMNTHPWLGWTETKPGEEEDYCIEDDSGHRETKSVMHYYTSLLH